MTSWGKPNEVWGGKFYRGRKSDTPWNHDLNWKNRCRLEKVEMKHRAAGNQALKEERKAELMARTKAAAKKRRFGVTGTLLGAEDAELSDEEYSVYDATKSTARSYVSTARSTARSRHPPGSPLSVAGSATLGFTGRSVSSAVTTASQRARLETLQAKYAAEAEARAKAQQEVEELSKMIQELKGTIGSK